MSNNHSVFVYGTLKKGFGNHLFLKDQKFCGEALIRGTLVSLKWFPGYIATGNDVVKGEVYSVDDETLKRLDHLEGHPRFYERREVKLEDNAKRVWCYCLPEAYLQDGKHPRISAGEWK